jgi:hypothetical protein
VLPNSVTFVGDRAFEYCTNLVSITYGKSVERLNGGPVAGDLALQEIKCKAVVPPIIFSGFEPQQTKNTTLYVPIQSLEAYRQANHWKFLQNIVGVNFYETDVNCDGSTNIADINAEIEFIINDVNTFDELYDVNGDGVVNISDINAIINAILSE